MVGGKHNQYNSKLTALFILIVLSVDVYILKSYRVYNLSNYGDEPDMKISLTSNSVTEWVAKFIPINLHQREKMDIE